MDSATKKSFIYAAEFLFGAEDGVRGKVKAGQRNVMPECATPPFGAVPALKNLINHFVVLEPQQRKPVSPVVPDHFKLERKAPLSLSCLFRERLFNTSTILRLSSGKTWSASIGKSTSARRNARVLDYLQKRSHAQIMEAQQSGSPESGSPSPVSSTSADGGKLPSVQQILPSLLGLQNWSLSSALSQATQSANQAHGSVLPRSSAAASFLLANQALQGLQAQQFFQLPTSNSNSQSMLSMPVGAGNQQMLMNNNQLLNSALVGLQSSNNSQNGQPGGVSLMNQFQLHQLLNSGLSGNQVLAAALNNQLLATAAAQSAHLAATQSGMLNQSVIRRAGKMSGGTVEVMGKGGNLSAVKLEESDEEGDESANSENGMDDKDERDRLDRGPTIAQLTNTPGVIRSTKGSSHGQSGKSSSSQSTKKSVASPTSSSSPSSAPTSTSPAGTSRQSRHEKSVICTTRSSTTNIVDGIDLEEIREFAKRFKMRRLSLGLTQTQVGQALSATEGPSYSQSAICRFEKLDITPRSAQKIKPVLERWMKEAEERYENGGQNLAEFVGCEPNKKRKRRTSFTPQALEILNAHFEKNTHPSGAEVTSLADELNYDREVVRVWFCNKRQALKNTIKKIKNSTS